MIHHRIYLAGLALQPGDIVELPDDEARHALRAKRLGPGDIVQALNGEGVLATAVLELQAHPDGSRPAHRQRGHGLALRITASSRVEPVSPAVEVYAATPKGGQADDLISSLSQVGAASWAPLLTERTVVDPRDAKLERLSRIAAESSKQCGRAWLLRTLAAIEFGAFVAGSSVGAPGSGITTVLAEATGQPYKPSGATRIRLLVGPEGGWSEDERRRAVEAGFRSASFGPHIMRIETAATVAAAIILAAERRLADSRLGVDQAKPER